MSAGMTVQCSIQEGHIKNLQESPCKVLQGNQIKNPATYWEATILRQPRGIANFYYGGTFADPAAWVNAYYTYYSTQTDVFTGQGGSYTGSCSAGTNYPTMSGYPASWTGSAFTGTGTGWAANPSIFDGYTYFPYGPQSPTVYTWYYLVVYPYPVALVTTLSGLQDYSPYYPQAKMDLLAQTFNSSTGSVNFAYKEFFAAEPPGPGGGGGIDISGLVPASYDGSVAPSGSVPTWWPPATAGDGSVAFGSVNGWYLGFPSFIVGIGLAKNTTGVTAGYFIAHYQAALAVSSSPGTTITTPATIGYLLTIDSTGTILVNQTIGHSSTSPDIVMPFPGTAPYPYTPLGNSIMICDLYIAVIGEEPVDWATRNSLVFT